MAFCSIQKVNKMTYDVNIDLDELRGIIIESAIEHCHDQCFVNNPTYPEAECNIFDKGAADVSFITKDQFNGDERVGSRVELTGHVDLRHRVRFTASEVRGLAFDHAISCLRDNFIGSDEFIPFIPESTLEEKLEDNFKAPFPESVFTGYRLRGEIRLPVRHYEKRQQPFI